MKKNEINKELIKKMKFIEQQDGYSDTYKAGLIKGLMIAIETIKEYKRGM